MFINIYEIFNNDGIDINKLEKFYGFEKFYSSL